MAEQDGALYFRIDADTKPIEDAADRAGDALLGIGDKASESENLITTALKGAGAVMASTFAVGGIKDFVSNMINVRMSIQRSEAALSTLLGSKEKAEEMMATFKEMSATSPIDLQTLSGATQTMLSFGVSADTAGRMMKSLGDISGGDVGTFQSLSLAFSQMSSVGRLMGQDLLQMINAGFNPLSEISRKTGKSVGELKEEMSKGKISAQEVTEAFISSTQAGGKFHGMLESQSKGLAGSFAKLQGAMNAMYNEVGEQSEGVISGAVDVAATLARNYQDVAAALAAVAVGYGVAKGSHMAYVAAEETALSLKYQQQAKALAEVMTAEQQARLSKVQSTASTKAYGEAIKEEIAVSQAAAEAKKKAAIEEAAATKAKATAAQTEVATAQQAVAAKKAEVAAITEKNAAVVQEAAAVQNRLATAQAEVTTAQEAVTAKKAEVAAARERVAAAQAEVAAAQEMVAAEQAEVATSREARAAKKLNVAAAKEMVATAQMELVAARQSVTAKQEELAAAKARVVAAQTEVTTSKKAVASKQAEVAATKTAATAKKVETLQTELNSAQERLNAALKDRATASTARAAAQTKVNAAVKEVETLQTTINTAATTANSKATTILTLAKNAATKAVAKLNAVIMANPYMIAAAAVGVLIYAIYKLATHQSEAEKRQHALNKAFDEGGKSATAETAKLKALYDELKSAKKGTDEYKAAKDAITKQYGAYLDKLNKEQGKVIDVADAYDLLAKKVEKAAKARAMQGYIDKQLEESGNKRGELIDKLRTQISGVYHGANLDKQLDSMLSLIGKNDGALNSWVKRIWDKVDIGYSGPNAGGGQARVYNNVLTTINELRNLNKQDKRIVKDAEKRFQVTLADAINETQPDTPKTPPPPKDTKGGGGGSKASGTDPAIERAKQEYALQLQLEQQEAAQAKKRRDEKLKREQEEAQQWEDGTAKQLKLIELDKQAKLNALQDEQDALVEKLKDTAEKQWEIQNPKAAQAGKHFDRKSITANDLKAEDKVNILEQAAHIEQDAQQKANKVYQQLIKDTRDFEQKRYDIQKEYAEKRKVLQDLIKEGSASDSNLKVLQQQEEEALKGITEQQLQQARKTLPIFTQLFADAAQKSRKEIQELIKSTEEFLKALADPEGQAKADKFGMSQEMFARLQSTPEQIQAIKQQLDKLKQFDNGSKDPFTKLFETIRKVKEETSQLSLEQKMQQVAAAAVPAMGAVKGITDQLATLFSAAGNDGLAEAASTVSSIIGGVSNIAQGFAQGGFVGGAVAALGEGLKVVTAAFEAAERHREALRKIQQEINEQQTQYIELLRKERLEGKEYDTAFGSSRLGKARRAAEVAKGLDADIKEGTKGSEILKQIKHRIGKGSLYSLFHRGPSPIEAHVGILGNIHVKTGHQKTGILGLGKGRDTYTGIMRVYKDLVQENGHLNLELAKSIASTRQFEGDGKKAFEELIKKEEQYREALQKTEEYLTGIFGSYGDDILNAVVDAFDKGTDAAQAFGDATKKVMQQMVKDMMQNAVLQPILKEQAEKVKQAFASGDERKYIAAAAEATRIIQGQNNKLRDTYEKLAGELKSEGIDLTANADNREGMKRGIATASQESVDENNGRLTAIQGHTYQIAQQTETITKNSAAILEAVMRVAGSTERISERLGRMEADTRAVRSTFEDIALRGIKLNS